jgi:serine/threonine protein phosphatase PrpC
MTAALQDEATRVTLESWLVTDVGAVRDHNEDSAFMEPAQRFFIVADGMGGHAAGEVASAMAVDTVKSTLQDGRGEVDAFQKAPSDAGRRSLVQLLQSAVLKAHQAVYQRGQTEQDKAGMGTTLDVVLIAGAEAFVAHVGDSRTYLIRDGKTSQITTDHTVAEVLVIEGKLTIEEAQVSPLRTILVNAIGVSADVGVEMAHVQLKRGDRLLLCSDGLHDYFPVEDEIAQRLSTDKPGDALKEMVDLAKTRGGHDNITGVAVHVTEIVDGVPNKMSEEPTHPVDVSINTFMQEEPTETAFIAEGVAMPNTVSTSSLRETKPMRAEEGDAKDTAKDETTEGAKEEAKKDAKDTKKETKKDAKKETKKDAKKDAKSAPEVEPPKTSGDAAAPAAPAGNGKTDDAAPKEEMGNADTGRIDLKKKE